MVAIASQMTSLTIVNWFIQAQIKENIKAPRHWPLCEEFTGTGEFPAKMASNAENVSFDDVIMSPFNGRNPGVTTTGMMLTSANFISLIGFRAVNLHLTPTATYCILNTIDSLLIVNYEVCIISNGNTN